jgi:hypothetical protein
LTVPEVDLQNEVDLANFTVLGRLIYDNTTMTPVFQTLGSTVTVSVNTDRPPTPGFDCGSFYGDSAHMLGSSELLAATGGAMVGLPPYIAAQGLPDMACDGSVPYCGPYDPNNYQRWFNCVRKG